jgi:hypothetical protein
LARAGGATTARRHAWPRTAAKELPFEIGSRAAPLDGGGVGHGYHDGRVTVLFDEVRYRTLALEFVAERDLLAAEDT